MVGKGVHLENNELTTNLRLRPHVCDVYFDIEDVRQGHLAISQKEKVNLFVAFRATSVEYGNFATACFNLRHKTRGGVYLHRTSAKKPL
jgi:hypothetical protein